MKSQINLNYHKATVLVGKLKLNIESRNINVKASTSDGSSNKNKQNGTNKQIRDSFLFYQTNEIALKEFRSSFCNIILK
jgi:hypothetical protein